MASSGNGTFPQMWPYLTDPSLSVPCTEIPPRAVFMQRAGCIDGSGGPTVTAGLGVGVVRAEELRV